MKSTILFIVALATILSGAAIATASPFPYGYRVREAVRGPGFVTVGQTREAVITALGVPNRRVSPNLWVYYRFKTADPVPTSRPECTVLLVTFDHARVADMKLVNWSGENLVVAAARAGRVPEIRIAAQEALTRN